MVANERGGKWECEIRINEWIDGWYMGRKWIINDDTGTYITIYIATYTYMKDSYLLYTYN